MSSPFAYLVNRFFYRLKEFLRHWYSSSFYIISHKTINLLERLDRFFALRISVRYWLKPLYQDYTVIGYIMGFLFRSVRILAGSIFYFLIIAVAAVVYVAWAALPIYIIYRGIRP